MIGLKLPVVIFSFLQYSALCHLNSQTALFLWWKANLNFVYEWSSSSTSASNECCGKRAHSWKVGELTSSLKWPSRYWTHCSARACSWNAGRELAHLQCVSTAQGWGGAFPVLGRVYGGSQLWGCLWCLGVCSSPLHSETLAWDNPAPWQAIGVLPLRQASLAVLLTSV